jgi:small subunit ribosomal protein S7
LADAIPESSGTVENNPDAAKSRRSRPPRPAQRAEPRKAETESAETAGHEAQRVSRPSVPTSNTLLFDKYDYGVEIQDLSLKNYINLKPLAYPVTYRRGSQKSFSKASVNIVERLCNSLMRGGTGSKVGGHVIRTKGRLQGKKLKAMDIIENAFEIISKQTGKNPLQMFIKALENSAPIEDTTRVVYGGIKSNVAVDISASRRLDIALRNVSIAAIIGAFSSKRRISDTLANEIVLASNNDANSYAIKRKNEIERMARSAK